MPDPFGYDPDGDAAFSRGLVYGITFSTIVWLLTCWAVLR